MIGFVVVGIVLVGVVVRAGVVVVSVVCSGDVVITGVVVTSSPLLDNVVASTNVSVIASLLPPSTELSVAGEPVAADGDGAAVVVVAGARAGQEKSWCNGRKLASIKRLNAALDSFLQSESVAFLTHVW